jgi:hypothetical protein
VQRKGVFKGRKQIVEFSAMFPAWQCQRFEQVGELIIRMDGLDAEPDPLQHPGTGGPLRRLGAARAARQGDSRLLRQGALTWQTNLPDQDSAEP